MRHPTNVSATTRSIRLAACVVLAAPFSVLAQPNANSIAAIAACEVDGSTAFVCSSKELSNVVLQCSSEGGITFVKFDDLEDTLGENLHEGEFACPEGSTVEGVFVKSGSAKADPQEGLPRGAGAFFGLEACPVECPEVPVDGEEPEEDEDEDEGEGEGLR